MASELNLDIRSDGYVRVADLLKLNITTFVKVPLRSHSVDEIREVSFLNFFQIVIIVIVTMFRGIELLISEFCTVCSLYTCKNLL